MVRGTGERQLLVWLTVGHGMRWMKLSEEHDELNQERGTGKDDSAIRLWPLYLASKRVSCDGVRDESVQRTC